QVAAALTAVAVEQVFAGIDVKRGSGFCVERTKSHELLSAAGAARGPVATLQILQQRNALFELFQILVHGAGVPSRSRVRDGGRHSQARMVGGEVFLNPQRPEAAEKREDSGPGQLQLIVAQDLSARGSIHRSP